MCEELREFKTDKCDFYPHEDIIFETEEDFLKRVAQLPKIIQEFSKDAHKVLVVGHSDLFWYLTSSVINGERFGKWLQNAEILEWEKDKSYDGAARYEDEH